MGNQPKTREQLERRLAQALDRVEQLAEENARLRRTRQVAETFQAASLALTRTFDLDTILERLLDYLGQLVPYDSATIFLLEGDRHLVARAARGYERWIRDDEVRVVGTVRFDLDRSPRHRALVSSQESLVIPDVLEDPSWEHNPSSLHIRSWMGVPLVAGGATIGLYSLDKTEPRFFTEEHLQLAEALAAQAATATQNALLYRQAQQELAEREQAQRSEHGQRVLAEALRDTAVLLNSSLDLDDVFEGILTQVARVVPSEAGSILLIDGDMVEVAYVRGYGPDIVSIRFPLSRSFLLRVLETGRPAVIGDVRTYDGWYQTPGTEWIRSNITTAIRAGEETIGFLCLERDVPYRFTPEHIARLQVFALQAGIAVRNARLFEAERKQRQMAESLRQVAAVLSATLDRDGVLARILEQLRRVIDYDSGGILLRDGDALVVSAGVGFPGGVNPVGSRIPLLAADPSAQVYQGRKTLVIADVQAEPGWVALPGTEYIRAWMGVPLLIGESCVGVLTVDRSEPGAYAQEDAQVVQAFAYQAAIAIENARLFAEIESQRRYSESVVGNSPVAIVTTDQDNRVMSWNPAAETLFGYRAEEAVGQDLDSLVTDPHVPEMRDQARRFTQEAMAGDKIRTVAQRCRRGGDLVDVEIDFSPLGVDGPECRYLTIYHDITELKRAEQAIRESERRLADIIDFLPDATLVVDCDGVVLAWNHAIEEMTGLPAVEMLGKGDHEYALPFYGERRPILIDLVLQPDDEFMARYEHLRQEGAILTGETYVSHLRGGERYLLATASALRDSRGRVIGAIETIRDITERKRAEDELAHAKEVAEGANRAKSTFLANMSHELRTPLNAILGFSQLMTRDPTLTADQQTNLEIIGRSGEHLLALINDVLELSKIEAGRTGLHRESFDLHHLLVGLEEMFHLRAEDQGLSLLFVRADDVPQYVRMDQGKLRQILINLLGNAVKFTPEGGVSLRVSLTEGGRALDFEVQDTGVGIAPEELDSVFDAFVQTASGQKAQEGTGLGLPISRRFARLMGGDITVSSELGVGTLFRLDVRFQRADAADVLEAQPRRRVIGLAPGQPAYRLLVVEDREEGRRLLTKLFEPMGFEVLEAANGQEAVEAWERWEPHLIWMDMRMPVMDGCEATRRIKATPKGQSTVIIALTASAFDRDQQDILAAGCDGFVRKPFRETELLDVLAEHLGVRYAYSDQAAEVSPEPEPVEGKMLAPHRLAVLPQDVVTALQRATMQGRFADMLAVTERIREHDEPLADELAELVNDFAYDRILALIEQLPSTAEGE